MTEVLWRDILTCGDWGHCETFFGPRSIGWRAGVGDLGWERAPLGGERFSCLGGGPVLSGDLGRALGGGGFDGCLTGAGGLALGGGLTRGWDSDGDT